MIRAGTNNSTRILKFSTLIVVYPLHKKAAKSPNPYSPPNQSAKDRNQRKIRFGADISALLFAQRNFFDPVCRFTECQFGMQDPQHPDIPVFDLPVHGPGHHACIATPAKDTGLIRVLVPETVGKALHAETPCVMCQTKEIHRKHQQTDQKAQHLFH